MKPALLLLFLALCAPLKVTIEQGRREILACHSGDTVQITEAYVGSCPAFLTLARLQLLSGVSMVEVDNVEVNEEAREECGPGNFDLTVDFTCV